MMQIMLHSKRVNVILSFGHYIIDEPKSFVTTKDAVAEEHGQSVHSSSTQ